MEYKCSKCGLMVIVVSDGKIIKVCDCEAPIVAELTVTVRGQSGGFQDD